MSVELNKTLNTILSELTFDFIHSSGPGGQNVNKVATAVQLRFDVASTTLLTEEIKQRLIKLAGKKVNQNGILVIEAKRFRSQEKNRQDSIERFTNLLEESYKKPKKRKPTKPTHESKQKRLDQKKKRSEIKKLRKNF